MCGRFTNGKILVFVFILQLVLFPFYAGEAGARTDVYRGSMETVADITYVRSLQVRGDVTRVVLKTPMWPSENAGGSYQLVENFTIEYSPEPSEVKKDVDSFGNRYENAVWVSPPATITITTRATVTLSRDLSPFPKIAPYPLGRGSVTPYEQFLQPTQEVQSDDPLIAALSESLASGCTTEYDVVDNVINWVAANVEYDSVTRYDAVWTLQNRRGVCTNYAHLALALLRSAGIPARFVVGYVLGEPYEIPYSGGTWEKSWDDGGLHAWIEVYYPDIGWVPYDPQDSKTFVDTRHVKFAVGLDRMSTAAWALYYRYWWGYVTWGAEDLQVTSLSDLISLEWLYFLPSPPDTWLWSREPAVVNEPPVADFSYVPISPTTLDEIAFTDLSFDPDGSIVSWLWDFGDGSTSTAQNPTHSYADDGTYTVTLTVTDDDGAENVASREISVSNVGPVAEFSFSPPNPTTQDQIEFTELSTDLDGSVVSWFWDFGDGSTSMERNPTHSYADDGTYTVTLTVTDDDGAENVASREISVSNVGPVAEFAYTPEAPVAGREAVFDASASSDPDGSITGYEWDWDDDGVFDVSGVVQTHVFPAGEHRVTLRVTDDDGATDTETKTIEVNEPPRADAGGPYTVREGETVELDGSGSHDPDGEIVRYLWRIAEDPTGTSSLTGADSVTPIFHAPRVESKTGVVVELIVTDDDGATGIDTVTITIQPAPKLVQWIVIGVISAAGIGALLYLLIRKR